jgi:sodium-dependent dicarboxylate transporter 2/3/5
MTVALSLLELYENNTTKKATGKAFMIAIPVTCLFSGMASPIGSSMNLLALDLLAKYTGKTISFVQWISVGIPLVMLILPVAWALFYKIYKPAEINPDTVKKFIDKLDVPEKMSSKEKKTLLITAVMLVLWILSSWVSQINVIVVALLGTCLLFFPGIEVLEWKPFIKNVNFNPFFLVGTVLSIGAAMESNGVSGWIASLFPTGQMPFLMLIAFTVALVFAMFIIMPVGPSMVMFLAVPLIALAESMGYSPVVIMLTLGMASGNCYLFPLDTVPLITYGTGYYSMLDMPKSTFPLQVYIVIVMPLVIWAASSLLHII